MAVRPLRLPLLLDLRVEARLRLPSLAVVGAADVGLVERRVYAPLALALALA